MQRGQSIDLLPRVTCLRAFFTQIPNFKLKFSCIIVVHNDHVVDDQKYLNFCYDILYYLI
jgi:hypothetical protein